MTTCVFCGKGIAKDPQRAERDGYITADAEQFCSAFTVGVYEHKPAR